MPARIVSAGIAVLAAAYAIAAAAVGRHAVPPTTYAAVSSGARAVDLAAGLGLLAAGAVAWTERRSRRLALLAVLAGVLWFAPDWEGWQGGPAIVRSLGAAAEPLFFAVAVHLVLAFPSGRIGSRVLRGFAGAAYAVAAVAAIGRALFREPFVDPYCWRNCLVNSFLVHGDRTAAQAFDDAWRWGAATTGVAVVLAVLARRRLAPALVTGSLLCAAEAAYAAALLETRLENPKSAEFSSLFLARGSSAAALALTLAWSALRTRRARGLVARVATELGDAPSPGKLRDALAAAVGDPALEVVYWLPGSQRFVDATGETVDVEAGAGTPVLRRGEQVALVLHEARADGAGLAREIGAAARLAVDNERLQAEIRAQLADLRASRTRIVERADAERRRLERDLHDGAQQGLLALSYDLRLARAEADGALAALLDGSLAETRTALDELRELAHGIFPAILTEAGLPAALETLAETAPLPVELGLSLDGRYAAPVEIAAYLTIAEAVADADARGASLVNAAVARRGERLVVEVEDDGAPRASPLLHVADRVGALGGSVEAEARAIRAEIPCA